MSLQSAADKPPAAGVAAESPTRWRFLWEAQSHTSVLRLFLFNKNTKPSAQCGDLRLSLLPQQSLLTATYTESESLTETTVRVPVPRVLVDPEYPVHFKALDDHIEAKLVLLLPVDHPLVSDFDSILSLEENGDVLRPFSFDSDIKKLSVMEELHLYCRNCSNKLTKGLRYFKEMPSVNWRDVADNWFGNCCCSFGGVSEKLVAEYAKSYTCSPGLCLLTTTSVLLCKDDILGCDFPNINASHSDLNLPSNNNCMTKVSSTEVKQKAGCVVNHCEANETSKDLVGEEKPLLMNEKGDHCNTGHCCSGGLGSSSEVQTNETDVELLENQKVFLDGYLGNGFMVKSSGLSKDIRWVEFLCLGCSCLVGAYPCFDDGVPLDGGVRLFKCYISTCLPANGPDDAFRNCTLERMFACELLESAEDELSFRTIVRDIQTKSPVLQIVLLNPNTWSCAGNLDPDKQNSKLVMHPSIKVLFSASGHGIEFDSRILDEWARKNQADEIYMFSSQILELIRVLELARSLSPPSCESLQGLYLSSLRR